MQATTLNSSSNTGVLVSLPNAQATFPEADTISTIELLRSLGVLEAASPVPAYRTTSPAVSSTPELELKSEDTLKRKREADEKDGEGDVVIMMMERKRARTGEMLEVVDLTQD